MEQINLTAEDKITLELKHKKSRDAKERDRIKAILLYSENWSVAMIAQALRIHQSSVIRHIEDYSNGKLTISSGGSSSMLSEAQTKELILHLESYTYQSTAEIISYIKFKYKITYSVPGLNKWLHRNNFSYKKPKGYPYKACKEQQQQFIEAYNEVKATTKATDGIMFMDSCHPSISTKLSYGWIKKGTNKPLETTASRTRINLIGALNLNKIGAPIVASYSTVDSESIADFLKQIRNYSGISGKIYLILDRAGYHCSSAVKNVAKNLNIKLFYLPPYSPNLNPIERLWKVMNEHARNNKFFKTAQLFKESILNFFRLTLPKISNSLSARINDNFQQLNYAF